MPKTKIWYLGLLIGAFVSPIAHAMVFDNRFIPLLQPVRLIIGDSRSEFATALFVTTASNSFNEHQENIGLPDIYGPFNQVELGYAIQATGKPNLLPSEYQGQIVELPWFLSGKRQSQGICFTWNQAMGNWLSTGFSWLFMRVESRDVFNLNVNGTQPRIVIKSGDEILLRDSLNDMFKEIGVAEGATSQMGFGDIDWYLRVGNMWDYTLRFRRIDAGFRLGTLFPTGVKREIGRPASIPFGGNGHWGMYGAFDGMFELREDWKAGLLFRVSKRFSKTDCQRMPALKEPLPWGAIVGQAEVNPGVTVVLSPWFMLENLRQGLMLGLTGTFTWHQPDKWCDKRADRSTPAMLKNVISTSQWASEYFTINVLYDFGKLETPRDLTPVFTFRWDVPSTLFMASRVNRAQRVTLGIDFVF